MARYMESQGNLTLSLVRVARNWLPKRLGDRSLWSCTMYGRSKTYVILPCAWRIELRRDVIAYSLKNPVKHHY